MSLDMGVVPSGGELSRGTVVSLLSRLFGDDEDLTEGVAKGEFAELAWEGERATTQWFVSAGRTGVSELVVSIADAFPRRPSGPYRAEVARVAMLLQDLARATGARFVVEEGDMTGATLNAVLDMVAPSTVGPRGPETYESGPAESGEDFLRRYLAAGDERLAWLRSLAGRTGGPDVLDLTRDSLGPLWEWAAGSLRLRAADAPRERIGLDNGSVFQRPVGAVLPMWFGLTAALAPYAWSDESLRMLDAVAFYLAETVRRAVPELSWRAGRANQPVLAGRGKEFEPISDVLMWLPGKVYHQLRTGPGEASDPPTGADLVDRFDAAVRG